MLDKNYTLKMGVDVSELRQAKKEISSSLKEISAGIKYATVASADYNSRLELLNKNVEENAKMEDALRQELEKLRSAQSLDLEAIKKKNTELLKQQTRTELAKQDLERFTEAHEKAIKAEDDHAIKLNTLSYVLSDLASTLAKKACKALVDFTKETINTGMQFESAFAGVRKVTSGTEEDFKNLESEIRKTALEKPISADQLASIYQMGSQLGIAKDGLKDFSNAIIDLAKTSDLTEEAGATMIAQYANVTGLKEDEYRKFASTLSYLGSTTATTESTIMDFASRISGSAKLIGMSHQEILALSTALGSVGIKAEMGGSAISKIMNNIDVAVDKNSKDLQTWAQVAGMSSNEFANIWKTNVSGAFQSVITGMTKFKDEGGSLNLLLEELDIKNIRQTETLKKLANASELLAEDMSKANEEWKKATFLGESASQVYNTYESKIQSLKNSFSELQISIYDNIKVPLTEVAEELSKFLQSDDAKKFAKDFANAMKNIISLLASLIKGLIKNFDKIIAIIKLATSVLAGFITTKVINGVASMISNIGKFATSLIALVTNLLSATSAQNALNIAMASNPIGMIATLIGLLVSGLVMLAINTEKATDEVVEHTNALKEQNNQLEANREEREKAIAGIDSEYNHYESLISELKNIVDENGKVKEGYESRVNAILPIIKDATGVEITLIDNQIVKYNELIGTIDNLIKKKRAEARLSVYEDDYKEAIKSTDQVNKEYSDLTNKLSELKRKRKNILEGKDAQIGDDEFSISVVVSEVNEEINKYQDQLNELMGVYDKNKQVIDDYEKMLSDYQSEFVISKTEPTNANNAGSEAGQAYVQGFSSFVEEGSKKTKEVTHTTYQELLNQEKAYSDQLKDYLNKVKDANSGVTVEMVEDTKKKLDEVQKKVKNMKELLGDNTVSTKLTLNDETYGGLVSKEAELKEQLATMQNELTAGNQNITTDMLNNVSKQIDQVESKIKALKNEWNEMGEDGEISDEFVGENTNLQSNGVIFGKGVLGENAVEMKGAGKDAAVAYLEGYKAEQARINEQIVLDAQNRALQEAQNYQIATMDPANIEVYNQTEKYLAESKQTSQAQGLEENAYKVVNAETWTLNQAIAAAMQIDFTVVGKYICDGIALGIEQNKHVVIEAVRAMMEEANSCAEEEEEIDSPSKVFYRYGRFMDLGLANGIRDYASTVSRQVQDMTSKINDSISLTNSQVEAKRYGTQDTIKGAGVTEINYNFTQNNTSAKSLDTLAIYQQSKSMLKRVARNQYV